MKYILVMLSLILGLSSDAQNKWNKQASRSRPEHDVRRIIIFHDTVKSTHYIIRERDVIRYTMRKDTTVGCFQISMVKGILGTGWK